MYLFLLPSVVDLPLISLGQTMMLITVTIAALSGVFIAIIVFADMTQKLPHSSTSVILWARGTSLAIGASATCFSGKITRVADHVPGDCSKSGTWAVQLLDVLCNKVLEPPQSTLMNAARFQVRDRVQKILRACAPVSASPGQDLCDLLRRQPPRVIRRGAVHDEAQGLDRTGQRFHGQPPRHAIDRLYRELAPKQPIKLLFKVLTRQLVKDAPTLTAPIKCHHQTRMVGCTAKPVHAQAKGAMPSACRAGLFGRMLDLGLPHQRAIGKQLGWSIRGWMTLCNPGHPVGIVSVSLLLDPGWRPGVFESLVNPSNMGGRERQTSGGRRHPELAR
jgi:hypothetical protein